MQKSLGAEVNLKDFDSVEEWEKRRQERNKFVYDVFLPMWEKVSDRAINFSSQPTLYLEMK